MTPLPNSADSPQQIGPYQIESELTRARSLVTYRAHDTLYERPVLLNVLPAALATNSALVREFISLGRDAARLHHPNLAAVYEAGHADGVNYIAQEFLPNGSLATRLQSRQHPYLVYDAIALIEPLAAALDYAHEQGYVHGALTASSILFDADDQPKLVGVGLLTLDTLGERVTYATNVSPYMAPEQARGEGTLDRHADIYTLGVIAFQLLAGQTPFAAENPLALLRKIIDDAPPVDDLLGGTLSATVRATLTRVLAKEAAARHATATAFATALVRGETDATPATVASQPVPDVADDVAQAHAVDEQWSGTVIDVEPAPATWQSAAATHPFIPRAEPVGSAHFDRDAGAASPTNPDPDPGVPSPKRRPLLAFSLLGMLSLLLVLLTVGRMVWNTYGAQLVDAALAPYAAVQASRLTPPQPPTVLTVPELAAQRTIDLQMTAADAPLLAGALNRTTTFLGGRERSTSEQPVIQAMSSAPGLAGDEATVDAAASTGSPPMVVVVPSSTPTDAPTDTPFPTHTPVPTATSSPTAVPPTATDLPTATASPEPSATSTSTVAPSPTATASPSPSPTATATASPTATWTATALPTTTTAIGGAVPTGRIAYTRWDSQVDRYNLIFYSIERDESWPIVPNRRQPDFAPNGALIASGDGGFIDNLVLMGTNGENPVPVSAHPEDAHPHWSPSGKQLVFDSTLVGDGRHRLYLHTDATFGQQLMPMMFEAWELFGRYPIFLSNGQIVYNGCDVWENASNCGLFRVDTAGNRPEGVTTWPGDIPNDNLGNQILATSNRSGNWDLYRIDPFSNTIEQLTEHPGRDGLATASPDGTHIAFVSDRGGSWAVYTMRVDGSGERKLFDLDGGFGSGERDWLQERISWGR